jgi:glycosyltransferase involved in cell wall biosynthesis
MNKRSLMKPTVLILSTYPFVKPRHGGQVRLHNIAKNYRYNGFQVESIAVYEPGGYSQNAVGKLDIPFPVNSSYRMYKGVGAALISDLQSGQYAESLDEGFAEVYRNLPAKIDVIHVEQPWLWPVARRIKQLKNYQNVILVFGTQNIESHLKYQILMRQNFIYAEEVFNQITTLEKDACVEADIVFAVTDTDCDTLKSWGAKTVALAENGISSWHADETTIIKWNKILPKSPWLLYIASAHPPNFEGVSECLNGALGSFPPDSKLVIAGSVSDYIKIAFEDSQWKTLNTSRLQLLGVLSDVDLAAVKTLAHGFLLPIAHGGGSNIKTAEALYSGLYVISTKLAFRGFENYTKQGHIRIANNSLEFHAAIREVLASPARKNLINYDNQYLQASLTWDIRLAIIASKVKTLITELGTSK